MNYFAIVCNICVIESNKVYDIMVRNPEYYIITSIF